MKVQIASLTPKARNFRSQQVVERYVFGKVYLTKPTFSAFNFLIEERIGI